MPWVGTTDDRIYFETHGAGVPVLLVPGLGGVGSYWIPNIPAFAARHQVIVHDHRGTGQSNGSMIRYSVDQMTDDLLRVMDHLKIEKAHLDEREHSASQFAAAQRADVDRQFGRQAAESAWNESRLRFAHVLRICRSSSRS